MQTSRTATVDLYWIPLGAGGHSVGFNGRVFEAIEAARRHRRRCDLYHAALVVELNGVRYTIEIAPSPDAVEASRGVVATGAVGSRFAGWLRLFRYEVRCWRGGSIPDLGAAVGGPHRISSDPRVATRFLELITTVPRPVWGRDELRAGEMWNSNSMIAWLIATAGLAADQLRPPPRGRAPGWHAGLEVARRAGRATTSSAVAPRCPRGSLRGRHAGRCRLEMAKGRRTLQRALDGGSGLRRIWSMGWGDAGHGPTAGFDADVPVATRALTGDLSTRLVRESGWPMSTAVSSLAAHPLWPARSSPTSWCSTCACPARAAPFARGRVPRCVRCRPAASSRSCGWSPTA